MRHLAARAQVVADTVEHVFARTGVPFRLRGAVATRRVGYVSRVVVQSLHFPRRDLFGSPDLGTTLDEAVRDLISSGNFLWDGVPAPVNTTPKLYHLRHRSGILTKVIA